MTLRNAFDSLGTEGMLRRILSAVTFAKDTNDRLRVTVDSGTVSTLQQISWGANATWPTYYGVGSPNSVDQRDIYRTALRANAMQARQHRWVIS